MTRDDNELILVNQNLQAQVLELARINEQLQQDLAGQQWAKATMQANARQLLSLVSISADWYWQQDKNYRFVEFSSKLGNGERDSAVIFSAVGQCRLDLSGVTPLTMS